MADWSFQGPCVDRIITALDQYKKVCFSSPTGSGKCFSRGTKILMHDGSTKPVEEIAAGSLVMGPDSQPREVIETVRGSEKMYTITPTKGEQWTCNESHILSLVCNGNHSTRFKSGAVINISVKEYLKLPPSVKHILKLYRAGVEFPEANLEVDPYFLGVWLGDGSADCAVITNPEPEIAEFLDRHASQLGLACTTRKNSSGCPSINTVMSVRAGRNPLMQKMKTIGVHDNKHIPKDYLINSRENRLKLLAGLVDTDGSLCTGCIDLIQKRKTLAEQIMFLCRSLGLACYLRECQKSCQTGAAGTYYRLSISGDLSVIPTIVRRKMADKRKQCKDVLRTGFTVTESKETEYYGFELRGPDRLFLLADFTVTHNSSVISTVIEHYLRHGRRCAVYTDRKVLRGQLVRTLTEHGFEVGTIAAGYKPNYDRLVQVCMIKTVSNRPAAWNKFLDGAGLVIVDEAHKFRSKSIKSVFYEHSRSGALLLGVTATPTELHSIYNHLVLGPSPKELEDRGVLVPVDLYAPSEIDMGGVKIVNGEYQGEAVEKRLRQFKDVLIGNVVQHYRRLNPYQLPSVCFAPTVEASRWLAKEFTSAGIPSEHIEADTPEEERLGIIGRWKNRTTKIVTNFGILTEGFDFPEMFHCIMARPLNSIANYIQIIGRVRRSAPGKTFAVVQDHVGNYYRHPNALYYHDWSLKESSKNITEKLRKKKERDGDKEPCEILCVECDLTWTPSREQQVCPQCKCRPAKPARKVLQKNGELKLIESLPASMESEFKDEVALRKAIHICANRPHGNLVTTAYGIAAKTLGRAVNGHVIRKPAGKDWAMKAKDFWHELFPGHVPPAKESKPAPKPVEAPKPMRKEKSMTDLMDEMDRESQKRQAATEKLPKKGHYDIASKARGWLVSKENSQQLPEEKEWWDHVKEQIDFF